jgi:hypothetical protein
MSKSKGMLRWTPASERDPVTGRAVERAQPAGVTALPSYFTREAVTPDDAGALFSVKEGDRWFPWISRPDEGRVYRVCDAALHNPFTGACIGGDRVLLITSRRGKRVLGWAPLSGGAFRGVVELPTPECGDVAASSDGRHAAVIYFDGKSRATARSLVRGECVSANSERSWLQPGFCLLHVDMERGITKGVAGGYEGFCSHPMISPVDPFLMEYCNAASWNQRQRMFVARYYPEGNVSEVYPLYEQKPFLEGVGHECFLGDGRVAAVYQRYARVGAPADEPCASAVLVIDPVTRRHTLYDTPGLVWNHLHGRDGRSFVSEGRSAMHLTVAARARLPEPPGPEAARRGLDLLCRYEVVRGRESRVTPLCVTGASWRGQAGHPHPVMDRAGKWCYFAADRGGSSAVWRVRMD